MRDLGPEPLPLDGDKPAPYGANYLVRTREQRRVAYDPALGRRGHGGRLGEETALARTLLQGGATGWWVPEAVVNHWMPRSRLQVSYLRRYFALAGQTYGESPAGRRERAALIGEALHAECAYRVARFSRDARQWVSPMIHASLLRGRLRR